MVDRGSNRKVSKNHIGGVKVSRIECGRSWVKQKSIKESHRWCKGSSVVDQTEISKNHIGGVVW